MINLSKLPVSIVNNLDTHRYEVTLIEKDWNSVKAELARLRAVEAAAEELVKAVQAIGNLADVDADERGWMARDALAAFRAAQGQPPVCEWRYDDDTDSWDTNCGQKWTLTTGTPGENGMRFCYHCGRAMKEAEDAYPTE